MDKLDSMKERLERFVSERDWKKFHNPKDLAMKLSIEASELLEKFEWKSSEESFSTAKEKKEEVASEMADVLAMLIQLSNTTGIDLYEAFNKKMDINDKRYPKELVKGKSHKYTYYEK
jgi:NTP pyrophosphatase (non-canonical NTP hydrolase)